MIGGHEKAAPRTAGLRHGNISAVRTHQFMPLRRSKFHIHDEFFALRHAQTLSSRASASQQRRSSPQRRGYYQPAAWPHRCSRHAEHQHVHIRSAQGQFLGSGRHARSRRRRAGRAQTVRSLVGVNSSSSRSVYLRARLFGLLDAARTRLILRLILPNRPCKTYAAAHIHTVHWFAASLSRCPDPHHTHHTLVMPS